MSNDDHDHKHCLENVDKLSEYIDGELDHATCVKIQKHAENCVACFSRQEKQATQFSACF